MLFNQPVDMNSSYSQYYPYQYAVSKPTKSKSSGGSALSIIVGIIGASILIGMALGLGLGIGAAGLSSNGNLTMVTNTTNTTR
ncbi:hypothetical protein I4U23_001814 [Adineta vaga]|nr:hypothetical protein I4U23_001814 [Adineta vaga]